VLWHSLWTGMHLAGGGAGGNTGAESLWSSNTCITRHAPTEVTERLGADIALQSEAERAAMPNGANIPRLHWEDGFLRIHSGNCGVIFIAILQLESCSLCQFASPNRLLTAQTTSFVM
jgi:hypothetical protein